MNCSRVLFVLLASLFFTVASCSKDGAVGPKGDTGAQGLVGPAGPQGANGQNGSTIYSGTGAPLASADQNGDFYLDVASGLLYGPKTSSGWGAGLSLKGAPGAVGATGAAGTQVYSGSGLPAGALGANGDYYLDKTSYLLYGPKIAGAWSTPLNLQGPAGPQGPVGPVGPQGPQGIQGNANVVVDSMMVSTTDWTQPNLSVSSHSVTLIAKKLTPARLLGCLVYISIKYTAYPSTVIALPYTDSNLTDLSYELVNNLGTGEIILFQNCFKINQFPPANFQLKYYIVLTPGIAFAHAHGINLNSLQSVRQGF